ncbi:MAG: TonB family protein [Pseudomonadota bacterium]|nr:TonB family protein [Pseudomonadota bacterium]
MSATTIERASLLTGRQMVLLLVIGLHALAIASLMAMRIPLDVKAPPGLQWIDPVVPEKLIDPPPQVVPPELVPSDAIVVSIPVLPGPVIGKEVLPSVPVETGINLPATVEPIVGTPGANAEVPATGLQSRAVRSPDDYYPATSIQLQEEGLTVVNVCVGPAGRLEGAPTVRSSSGSRRLDAAALKWAGEALVFTPATRNGAAVSACREYRVRFTLR